MILLDTHIWVWWIYENPNLTVQLKNALDAHKVETLAISSISLWEVAKLVEKGRLEFSVNLNEWFEGALEPFGVKLLPLSPSIAVESISLPENFHDDPADQIIVATARSYNIPLATFDSKILKYKHVDVFSANVQDPPISRKSE